MAAALLVLGFAVLWFTHKGGTGSTAVITKDGKLIGTYPLSLSRTIDIEEDGDINRLVIENGAIYMESANCKGQDCVGFGKIRKPGQVILCLPHKLSVTIKGEGGSDAVSF